MYYKVCFCHYLIDISLVGSRIGCILRLCGYGVRVRKRYVLVHQLMLLKVPLKSFTLCKSPRIWTVQKRSQIFICGTYNAVEQKWKELKPWTGVLLMNDPAGHGQFSQSADFYQKRVGWPCPVKSVLKSTTVQGTVSDWVPKKDSANFESDTFLWFAYVVNMSKIATFLGRFWIFG